MTLKCVLCYLAGMVMLATMNGCGERYIPDQASKSEPKFSMNEEIKYLPSKFYKKVCSGKGTVIGVQDRPEFSGIQTWVGLHCYFYTIQTPWEEKGCPTVITIHENDLIKVNQ